MMQIDLPEDVQDFVLRSQLELKLEKGTNLSQAKTVIHLLRKLMKLTNFEPAKKPKEGDDGTD